MRLLAAKDAMSLGVSQIYHCAAAFQELVRYSQTNVCGFGGLEGLQQRDDPPAAFVPHNPAIPADLIA